jgi:PTS system ascorbate-specific IIA component
MPVSILLITHNGVGAALLETVVKTFGVLPTVVQAVSVDYDIDPEKLLPQLRDKAHSMDMGDGVLILTDMLGATPSNLAQLLQNDDHVLVIAGLNLPMLMRVVNYSKLPLIELAQKALTGGRDGICNCHCDSGIIGYAE